MSLSFSQRMGFSPVRENIQISSLDVETRNAIWNLLHYCVFENNKGGYNILFWEKMWIFFIKEPADVMPLKFDNFSGKIISNGVKEEIRNIFFNGEWWRVFDLLQYLVTEHNEEFDIDGRLNYLFQQEKVGYRFIDKVLSPITSKVEISEIEKASGDGKYKGAAFHIQEALRMLSDRNNPDFRNSIKESISAVESVAKVITGNPKATLGDALIALGKEANIHSGLKKGFEGLYGYTNDKENGIRHAIFDDAKVITLADAQYFLVSCSAFVNYLKTLSVGSKPE